MYYTTMNLDGFSSLTLLVLVQASPMGSPLKWFWNALTFIIDSKK